MTRAITFSRAGNARAWYVTDLSHRASRVRPLETPGETLSFALPEFPAALHVKLSVPDYGTVWAAADNSGAGYCEECKLDLLEELALSRIRRVERRSMELDLVDPSGEALDEAWDLLDFNRPLLALRSAIFAGEDLELAAARERLSSRASSSPPLPVLSSNFFGSRLDSFSIGTGPDWTTEKLVPNFLLPRDRWDLVASLFNGTTLPNHWRWIEFSRGRQRWVPIEEILAFTDRHQMQAKSFSIFWGGIGGMPPWFRELAFSQKLQALEKWTNDLVGRLKDRVTCWTIASSMHDWPPANRIPQLSHEQAFDIIRLISELVGSLDPSTPRIINHCAPWGEYVQHDDGGGPWTPLSFLDELAGSNIEFEGIGIELDNPDRDLMECAALLDRFGEFGKQIHITEMGVPSGPPTARNLDPGRTDPAAGWRGPWTEEKQAEWLVRFYTMAIARPSICNISYRDFDDGRAFVPRAGLVNAAGEPKAAFYALLELLGQHRR